MCVRGGEGVTLCKWFCLLFHFLPNVYARSSSCPLFLLTSSLSSSSSIPAQCHPRPQVTTSDPLFHFFCPKSCSINMLQLPAVRSFNFNSARRFLQYKLCHWRATSSAVDILCYLTLVLSTFLFLMLWLHSVRLAAQLRSFSSIWNTHAYLFPVNEAAACHKCALSNKMCLLLFSIYLLEIKTFLCSLRSNHGLRFKIGYSNCKRMCRWKVKLSLR